MRLFRVTALLTLIGLLAACAEEIGAPAADIARARYTSAEAPYIAVVSAIYKRNERAAHTALVINASERVVYDPAGTFRHPDMPERGDVHYGVTDGHLAVYESYHAREAYYVHIQKIDVSAATAETALRRVQAQGPSPKAFCTNHTTTVLQDIPGFENVSTTFYPENLRQQIAMFPQVEDSYRYEDDVEKALPEG